MNPHFLTAQLPVALGCEEFIAVKMALSLLLECSTNTVRTENILFQMLLINSPFVLQRSFKNADV